MMTRAPGLSGVKCFLGRAIDSSLYMIEVPNHDISKYLGMSESSLTMVLVSEIGVSLG